MLDGVCVDVEWELASLKKMLRWHEIWVELGLVKNSVRSIGWLWKVGWLGNLRNFHGMLAQAICVGKLADRCNIVKTLENIEGVMLWSTDANRVNSGFVKSPDLFLESCSCPLHGHRLFQNHAHCSKFFAPRAILVARILHVAPLSHKLRFESCNDTTRKILKNPISTVTNG